MFLNQLVLSFFTNFCCCLSSPISADVSTKYSDRLQSMKKVCVHVCVCACACAHAHVHVCVRVRVRVRLCMCMYICVHVCACM